MTQFLWKIYLRSGKKVSRIILFLLHFLPFCVYITSRFGIRSVHEKKAVCVQQQAAKPVQKADFNLILRFLIAVDNQRLSEAMKKSEVESWQNKGRIWAMVQWKPRLLSPGMTIVFVWLLPRIYRWSRKLEVDFVPPKSFHCIFDYAMSIIRRKLVCGTDVSVYISPCIET